MPRGPMPPEYRQPGVPVPPEYRQPQPWALIAIAVLSVLLAGIALLVAFDAQEESDDDAGRSSLAAVRADVADLRRQLGIAERTIGGEDAAVVRRARGAAIHSQDAVNTLTRRIENLERQSATLTAGVARIARLSKEVGALEAQVGAIRTEIASLNSRVRSLSKEVDSLAAGGSGGAAAP